MSFNILTKMRKVYYLLFTAVLVGLVSCTSNDELESVDKKINLKTAIEAKTPTKSPVLDENGNGNFSKDDVFNLLVVNAEGKYNEFNYVVGTSQLYWKDITVDGANAAFAACYPSQNIVDGKFLFDLATASDKDLLLAFVSDVAVGSESSINLNFKHAMHCIKVKFTAEAGVDIDKIQTTCSSKSSCEVNLLDGSVNVSDTDKTSFSETGDNVSFLVVPQNASDVTLEVKIGSITKTFTIGTLSPDLSKLNGGMQLELGFTVKKDNIEIENIAISGWENQGSINGEIIL